MSRTVKKTLNKRRKTRGTRRRKTGGKRRRKNPSRKTGRKKNSHTTHRKRKRHGGMMKKAARVAQAMPVVRIGARHQLPTNIVRNIAYSLNGTPAQRLSRDRAAHRQQMYDGPLDTIDAMGDVYMGDPDEAYLGDLGPEDFANSSFSSWLFNPEFHQQRGVYGQSMRGYMRDDFNP
jgi:hypothetical protein